MSFFSPLSSFVVVGASEDPKKIGNILLSKNQHFSGRIYGVNPKWGSAYGCDFYPDISSLPEVPDIAVFAIPEFLIYDALESAWKFGIKKAIIITAGFWEIGKKDEENRLHQIAQKYGIRFLGPNCLGYGNTKIGLNLSFGGQFFSPGNIGIISQSGAMAVAITDILESRKLWFSQFFSLGNKTDLDETDALQELMDDAETRVIALYLESISRGREFLQRLTQIAHTKPVIIMIGWVSERGKSATASHTGSLSGDRLIYEAALRQGGAILTYELAEFFDFLEIFSLSGGTDLTGNPFIITNAWGIWVLSTDQSDFHRLDLANITPEEDQKLRLDMPLMMSTKNPIDIIGDADSKRVGTILRNIAIIRNSSDILLFFTVQATTDIDVITQTIIDFQKQNPDHHLFVGLIGGSTIQKSAILLADARIFVTETTESLIGSYQKLLEWRRWSIKTSLPKKKDNSIRKPDSSMALLDQNTTEKILADADIQTTQTYEYSTLDEVLGHTHRFHGPYIMKIAGKHIAHKTEIGGVSGRLISREEVSIAYGKILKNVSQALPASEIDGVTIGRFIDPSPSFELFFWAKRDPSFGEVYVLGAGGIYVSILADTRLHIGKWEKSDILLDIEALRSYPAISGYRKQRTVDIEKLVDMIYRLSSLFSEHPEIQEIDINPILFSDGKPVIADAKFYM